METESPDMVAGRLEIRVVSSPQPPSSPVPPVPGSSSNNGSRPGSAGILKSKGVKSDLEKFEESYGKEDEKVADEKLPQVLANGVIPQPKMLKSILKNKSDSSIGERALRIDTRLSIHKDSDGTNDTPEIVVSEGGNNNWPQSKVSMAESCDFQTAKTHHDGA